MQRAHELVVHPRSIVRKLMAIYAAARNLAPCEPSAIGEAISDGLKALQEPFRYFLPDGRVAISDAESIAVKVRFAILLGILDDKCKRQYGSADASVERMTTILAQRAKALLEARGVTVKNLINKSRSMLRRETPDLPTASALHHECRPRALGFKSFRACLTILSYEPDGSLGAYAKRLYLPRTEESQASEAIRG